ncbi:MAG: hypothetical protein R3C15_04780 [Thermoleophilia bacterium]
MRLRHLVAVAVAGALVAPAAAQAQPNRYELKLTLRPGQQASMTIGTVPRGEFAFFLRASSDGEKAVTVRQRANGAAAFVVLDTVNRPDDCEGAAGSVFCSDVTAPATPAGKRWTFTVKSTGSRPTSITLRITFRKVANAQ